MKPALFLFRICPPKPLLAALVFAVAIGAQVDQRRSQSAVKNQGNRGTCVAFAICAALETFPGVPTDLSEQLLYATVKRHEQGVDQWLRTLGRKPVMSEGNAFESYVPLFELVGTSHELFLPYDPNPRKAGPSTPDELRRYLALAQIRGPDLAKVRDGFGKYGFRAQDSEVLQPAAARDVARLKKEFDGGRLAIPVSYAVYGPAWSNADEDPKRARTAIHPGMMFQYKFPGDEGWQNYGAVKLRAAAKNLDFVQALYAGQILAERLPDPDKDRYGGHAVTLVGYDANGFLAKNSWGSGWGDNGYCTVLFDYHGAFATRALLINEVYIRTPRLSPFAQSASIREADFRVKVQARGDGDAATLEFSLWTLAPRDPNVEVVEYAVEVRGRDGRWSPIDRRVVAMESLERRCGAPLQLSGVALRNLRAGTRGRVTMRFGGGNQVDPTTPSFLRTLRFEEFAPWPQAAMDLAPAR